MNVIVNIQDKNIGAETNSVNARELHSYIQAKQEFANWIKNRIKKYGFTENQDYIIIQTKRAGNNATLKEYFITLDMAKELSMVENNEKGREARRYFIEVDKQYTVGLEQYNQLQETILQQNAIIADLQKQLPDANTQHEDITDLQKNFKIILQEHFELENANAKLRRDNANLQRALISFSDRYHSIVLEANDKVKAIKGELEKMTNRFQLLPNLKNDGKNLNTDTKAGHKYW